MYETESTLANERRAIERICKAKGLTAVKLPITRAVDYALYGPGLPVWLEYKNRPDFFNYREIILSEAKVIAGQRLASDLGGTFVFLIESGDAMMRANLTGRAMRVAPAGRRDRNDPKDVEPCCHIPRAWFREVRL